MKHHVATDETRERAALYALGALSADGMREFEAHLEEGCAPCAAERETFGAVASNLALAARPVTPDPSVRVRLLGRARESQTVTGVPTPFRFVRADEGVWEDIAEGVSRRSLTGSPGEAPATYLIRIDPGVTVFTHTHDATEHCYVLEGDLRVENHHLEAGDYHEAAANTEHADLSSDNGCVLLIVESPVQQP
jgi:anti-sigma factor ChrR (cupin superfamily)